MSPREFLIGLGNIFSAREDNGKTVFDFSGCEFVIHKTPLQLALTAVFPSRRTDINALDWHQPDYTQKRKWLLNSLSLEDMEKEWLEKFDNECGEGIWDDIEALSEQLDKEVEV